MGMLQPGQTYTVPATATAPLLKAGKPEALKVTVGSAVAPPVGPAGQGRFEGQPASAADLHARLGLSRAPAARSQPGAAGRNRRRQ